MPKSPSPKQRKQTATISKSTRLTESEMQTLDDLCILLDRNYSYILSKGLELMAKENAVGLAEMRKEEE